MGNFHTAIEPELEKIMLGSLVALGLPRPVHSQDHFKPGAAINVHACLC